MYLLAVLVILGSVADSWQKCYHNHCPHQTPLSGCVGGTYTCQADEFCQTTTHLAHGNAPWVVMECRPNSQLADCLARQSSNVAGCDPNQHDLVCSWCCDGHDCMQQLSQGIIPSLSLPSAAPATTTTTSTAAAADSTTTTTATTTTDAGSSASTQTISADVTTTGTTALCQDLFLGDCAVDYAGRCGESLIAQLCAKTCGVC